MKTSTFIAAAVVLGAAVANAQSPVPSPLPEGVYSVSPAQGWVDTSNNASPMGVSDIAITFTTTPEVNPMCQGEIALYVDGSDIPAETLGAAWATRVDAMGYPVGGFTFSKTWNAPGLYRITVPEGAWLLNGTPSPAIELNYGIRRLQTLTPAPGIYESIDALTLQLAGTDVVQSALSSKQPAFFMGATDITFSVDIEEYDDNSEVFMRFSQPVTAAGTYTLLIPGGAFTYTTVDGEEISSQEIVAQYTISAIPVPEITPAPGEVAGFDRFTITMPEGYSISMVDNMGAWYIYPVTDGEVGQNGVAMVKIQSYSKQDNTVELAVIDEDGYVVEKPFVPEAGEYALRIRNNSISGFYDGTFLNCPPFTYYYTVNPNVGVGKLGAVEAAADVYTAAGILVGHNMERTEMQQLPAGLYIISGGRKVVVK